MTIYATPFKHSDKQTTGPSTDSGLASIPAAVDLMGPDYTYKSSRMVIYGAAEARVVFSDFVFRVDALGSTL